MSLRFASSRCSPLPYWSLARSSRSSVNRTTGLGIASFGHTTPVRWGSGKAAADLSEKSDADLIQLIDSGKIHAHNLEKHIPSDLERAVDVRRQHMGKTLKSEHERDVDMTDLPYKGLDYDSILGACAENVVGYIPIPLGVAGPVLIDGRKYYLPMATTEGCLIASTHRGCKAITLAGGATTSITGDGMTRGPVIRMPSGRQAAEMKLWLEDTNNFYQVAAAFNSTSRFARLSSIQVSIAGRLVFLRFKSNTGDAMGMNMISKGVEKALDILENYFPKLDLLSISGNFCTDKKPSAVNWLQGRGKSVIAEVTIPNQVVKDVLKTEVDELVDLNIAKNLVGSAMAGSIGGNNAHASNIVAAMFIATGQDPAQNVESSNCMTLMEKEGEDLYMSVSMPSIEVGTIGGGTHLPPQAAALDLMGLKGANPDKAGRNSKHLARVIATAVLAGELSLMSALAAGHLVRSHMVLNRNTSKEASNLLHVLPHDAGEASIKREDGKKDEDTRHVLPGTHD